MAMDFALSRRLARMPQPPMRFVSLGSELCLRLPSDHASRHAPLPSASSFRHQDLQGTLTPEQLPMPGTRKRSAELVRLTKPSSLLGGNSPSAHGTVKLGEHWVTLVKVYPCFSRCFSVLVFPLNLRRVQEKPVSLFFPVLPSACVRDAEVAGSNPVVPTRKTRG